MHYICTTIVAIASFCITGSSLGDHLLLRAQLNGYTVAIDGDTCVIGTHGTNSYTGSAYLYTLGASGLWNQVAELSGEANYDSFGYRVAIDGNTCVIGAYGTNSFAGSAYFYTSDASGTWNQVAALSGEESSGGFGYSVAIDGNTCVIGADGTNSYAGSAYVYSLDASGIWNQVAELSGEESWDQFGTSVAIDGDTCVIGAPGTNDTGSAYVYTSDASGTWNQVDELSGEAIHGHFGSSVAIDGNTCVIGAYGTNDTGSAYFYTSDASGTWNQVAALSGEESNGGFGYSVAIDGHACVIGAPGTNSHTGSAYVYTSDASGTWNQVLAISGEANYDSFGYRVAIDGAAYAIGAPGTNSPTGSAYVYYSIANAEPTGACCVSSGCVATTDDDCTALGGTWQGEDGLCEDCAASCTGDVNGDGAIDGADLAQVLAAWGMCP